MSNISLLMMESDQRSTKNDTWSAKAWASVNLQAYATINAKAWVEAKIDTGLISGDLEIRDIKNGDVLIGSINVTEEDWTMFEFDLNNIVLQQTVFELRVKVNGGTGSEAIRFRGLVLALQ